MKFCCMLSFKILIAYSAGDWSVLHVASTHEAAPLVAEAIKSESIQFNQIFGATCIFYIMA